MLMNKSFELMSVAILAFAVGVAGCQQPMKKTYTPTDPAAVEALRAAIAERNPNSNVGVVSLVLPDGKFASVADMPVEQFKKGDVVSFVDAQMSPLANGTVLAISGTALHVEVEQAAPGGRAVQVGDIAVRFKP